MKTKLVLWGKDDQEAKVLVAVQLRAEDNQADVWTFHGEQATGDLHKRLLYEWREGKEMAFPESGYQHHESELSAAGRLLPEGVHAEKPELIERAKTEWHFVVLSSKLNEVYQIELAELREQIEGIENYSGDLWDQLKLFWDKVREQMQDNNLARDHANSLKRQVNGLFSHLKDLRSAQEEDFQANSKVLSDKFNKTLDEVNKRIEKGEMLHLVFEELKAIQRDYRTARLTREDRSPLWERIDGAFKAVKERRFGPSPTGNTPVDRHQNRLNGLMDAIAKMEKSIKRDQDDLNAQERKKGSTNIGQLESQLLDAKVQIIKGRMKSKETKLEDMHKTRVQVEQKLAQSKKSLEDKAAKKVAATKEKADEAIVKVKEVAEKPIEKVKEKADEAIDKVKEVAEKPIEKVKEKAEEAIVKVKEVAEKPVEKVKEKAGEAIDKVKEVAEKPIEKVKEKADEAIVKVKEVAEKPIEKVKEKAEEAIVKVKEVAEKPIEKVKEKADEAIDKVKEVAEKPIEKVKEKADEAIVKVKEVAEKPIEKVKEKADEAIDKVKEVAEKPIEKVKEKADEAIDKVKEVAEKPIEKVKEKADEAIVKVKEVAEKPIEKVKEKADEAIVKVKEVAEKPIEKVKEKAAKIIVEESVESPIEAIKEKAESVTTKVEETITDAEE